MADVPNAIATVAATKAVTFVLAGAIGLGLGAMLSPSQVTVPGVGTVSSLFLGGATVAVAGAVSLARDRFVDADCGCGGGCNC